MELLFEEVKKDGPFGVVSPYGIGFENNNYIAGNYGNLDLKNSERRWRRKKCEQNGSRPGP